MLSIIGLNVNGFCSSQTYVEELLETNEIVVICEHMLSDTELHKLQISQSHNVFSKCNSDLLFNPPEWGHGYVRVALYCNKSLSWYWFRYNNSIID